VVIVGNGNVALDMARLLAKAPAEFAGSDLDPGVAEVLARAPVRTISVLGRRSAAQTAFSPIELAELGQLAHALPKVDPADLPLDGESDDPVLRVLRDFAGASSGDAAVRIQFLFGRRVLAFRGHERLEAVELASPEGTADVMAADLLITCIGYHAEVPGLEVTDGHLAHADGLIAPGLYVTGWARRGPSGTIATNRAEAHEVARRIAADLVAAGRAGGEGLAALLRDRGVDVVDWARWKAIDAAELAAATPGRVRTKFRTVAGMLAVPRSGP
jgi:ferredoxin--NADP+ reductase